MKKIMVIFGLLLSLPVSAQQCPGDDPEPAMTVKTKEGLTVFLCGFEDRDVPGSAGKRAFSEFEVYYSSPKDEEAKKIFTSESSETYWVRAEPGKGLSLEELWFFSDKPQSAFRRDVICNRETCSLSEAKCILKMKKNPFPKALGEFRKRLAAGNLGEEGEDLIDQIFAQAFLGDKAAIDFYGKFPEKLDPSLQEAFSSNKKKLDTGCKP